MTASAELRCEGCGKTAEEIARLHPERVPRVQQGPGGDKALCNRCWANERPSWHAGPARG